MQMMSSFSLNIGDNLLHSQAMTLSQKYSILFTLIIIIIIFLILLDTDPFCGATDCSCFGLHVYLLMGFKSKEDLLPVHFCACVQ